MKENSHDFNAPAAAMSPDQKPKTSYGKTAIATLFIVCFIFTIFSPTESLSEIMYWVMLLVGVVAGGSLFISVFGSSKGSGPIARFLAAFAGLGGAIIIMIISLFAAVFGALKYAHGD